MIRIEKIKEKDLIELSGLLTELTGSDTNISKMHENFHWMDKNSDYVILGAWKDNKLLGSLMGIICRDLVKECRPFMVIENVIVTKEARGMHIGKKLMKEIENIGRSRNCSYTMFVSSSNREDAHKFYESLGYSLDLVQGFKKYL